MAKRGPRPEPWLRRRTGAWYVTLDGRQVPLGRDKAEAYAEFYRLMAARGEGPAPARDITTRRLYEVWILACARSHSGRTMETYRLYSGSFVRHCGDVPARELRPYHVEEWVAALERRHFRRRGRPWSKSTRSCAISVVKAMTSWGDEKGYLAEDPLRKLKAPEVERRAPITLEDATAIMEAVRPDMRDALRVLLTTGVRPGELCSMSAERIDLAGRKAVVRGKTGVRTVYLGAPAVEVLRALMERRPSGPLLVSRRGEPMSVNAIHRCIVRARRRLSARRFGKGPDGKPLDLMLEHIKPHCFRGLFSTEALRAGVGMFDVSKLLGHRDPTVLAKHYANADDEMLRAAADRATRRFDTPPGTAPDPRG